MSWSFSIKAVPKEEFAAAVDSAVAIGQPADSHGLAEDVSAAKGVLKGLAPYVKRSKVGGSASGHCLQPSDGSNYSDSISVSVYGDE